jgi:hypothetical protein
MSTALRRGVAAALRLRAGAIEGAPGLLSSSSRAPAAAAAVTQSRRAYSGELDAAEVIPTQLSVS